MLGSVGSGGAHWVLWAIVKPEVWHWWWQKLSENQDTRVLSEGSLSLFSKEQTTRDKNASRETRGLCLLHLPKRGDSSPDMGGSWVRRWLVAVFGIFLESRANEIHCFQRHRGCVSEGQQSRRMSRSWHEQLGEWWWTQEEQEASGACGERETALFSHILLKCMEESMGVVSQRHLEMNLEFRGKIGLRN